MRRRPLWWSSRGLLLAAGIAFVVLAVPAGPPTGTTRSEQPSTAADRFVGAARDPIAVVSADRLTDRQSESARSRGTNPPAAWLVLGAVLLALAAAVLLAMARRPA